MADVQVDELSIKLSSALDTKLISNLKAISDGLSALKTSLDGLNGQKAVSGMQAVGAGIQNLSASLKSVDSKKLGDIANAVSKLSSASDKIGKMFGGSTSQVKETNKAAKELDKTLNSLVNTYVKELGVKGKEGTGAVKSAVSDVIKGAKDGDVFGSMLENFDKALPVIYKYADGLKYVDNQAADTAKSVLAYMKGINSYNKVFLDNQDTGRGLDFSRKRMQMGPAFTSTKPTSGGFMRWHEFINDYNQNSGDVVSEDTDFYQFYDRIMQMKNAEEQYRQSAMASSEVRDAISEELMNLCTKAQEAAKEFTDLGEATKNIGGSESATATFSNLKTALDSLSEIEAVPDMSWLTQMSKALQNLASPEISTAVANMPTVITGISELTHGLAGVTVPDLTDISELIKVVSGLGGKGVSGAVNNLPQLANYLTSFMGSLEHLPEVPFTAVADIGTLAREISKFGGKNATGAVTNLPQMGAAVKQLLNDVASAPPIDPSVAQTIQGLGNLNAQAIKGLIQLSNESEKSAKKVNVLSKAFKGVGNAGKGFVSTIGKGITALKNLRNHTTNLGQTGFAQLTKSVVMVRTALWGLQRVASGFMDSINLASDLVEVNNVIDHVFGNYTTKIEEIADTSIEKFGISELTFKKTAGQFQAMASTMGITDDMVSGATQKLKEMGKAVDENGKYAYESTGKMQDMATSITEWVADIASFYDMDYAEAATKAQSIFSGTTRPLRSIGVDLTQANLKAWALANGLNADIENMTQAEKATLRFQYALSATSVATGDFQRTSQTWANQVRILKEQFNALKTIIGTGLISALKPFVASMNSALSGILKFAQNVLNALGKIFGWEVEIAAGGVSMDDSIADLADGLSDVGASGDDAASGTGKAAKALEEYKRQVLSFDELHMLSAPNDNNSGGSGGSGGGGGAGGSGGAGGGGTGSAGDVSVAFKRTKALYESEIDTLRELGTYIADTLTSTLNNISWSEIQEKATGFGTGLADFLNGLFDTDTGLATALGNTVEGAINTAISVAFGFGNRFDFAAVGTDFGMAVDSAIDGIDWPKALAAASSFGTGVAKALNAFIKPKTFNSVGKAVANYIGVRITAALKVSENFKFGNLGTSIASAVNGALNTGKSQKYFKKLGQTVSNLIAGGLTTLSTFIGTTDWSGVRDAIIDVFSGFSWKDLKKAGQNLVSALFKAVVKNLGGDNKSWITVKTELKQLFEQIDIFGDKVGEGLKWFYDNVLEPMGKWTISEAIPNFLNTLRVALDLLNTVLDTAGPALKILWDGFLEPAIHFGADSFIDFWRDLTGVLTDVDNALESSGLSDKLTTLGNAMEGFADIYNNKVKPVIESLRPFLEFLRDIAIQYPGESFLGGISNAANIVSAISKAINGTGEDTVNKNYRANVDVSLQKKGWNGFTSWLGGDATGDNNSGKLNTTNTVTNTGQKVKPYLTGNDDGKTETLNTALSMKPPSIETPTKFLDWLTGGKNGGQTTTWNTAKAKKPDVINTKNKFLNWLTGGKKGGETSTKNTANTTASYGKYSTYKDLITQKQNGVNATAWVSPSYGGWSTFKQQITGSSDGTVSVTIKTAVTGAGAGLLNASGIYSKKANGGIFSGGKWHNIAAYAGGVNSAPTGQLFLAREAGPELVGSLGNHTAVMNNDQIVASVSAGVYSAVRSAMSGVNAGGNNQAPVIEVIVKTDSETLYRQVKRGEKTYNGRYSTVATVM